MHTPKPLTTYILSLTTTALTSATPTNDIPPLKCDTTALSTFIPSNVTQPNPDFQQYLQQPLCTNLPNLFGLDAKNRFQEDYERFAMYFNERYTSVPKVCKERFGVRETVGSIPGKWDAYGEQAGVNCKKGGGGHVGGGKGYEKVTSAALGGLSDDLRCASVVTVVALVVHVLVWVLA